MTTIADIIRHVEQAAGHTLNGDEGVQHGDGSRPVTGVTVAWMGTPDAAEAAGRAGHELLIVHESLFHPYNVLQAKDPPVGWQGWTVNRRRREALDRHRLTCVRIHGTADEICIFDDFAALLELGKPIVAEGLCKIYEIPPCTVADLVARVKRLTGMAAIRVAAGDALQRVVRRVGLPWGGLGLFVNVTYPQRLVELGCDVFIAGEADNYGFRFALESGVPMIETSHEISENPGLRRFTAMLQEAFPDVVFRFHENACVWQMM